MLNSSYVHLHPYIFLLNMVYMNYSTIIHANLKWKVRQHRLTLQYNQQQQKLIPAANKLIPINTEKSYVVIG
jgi:hypothetical protein